MPIDEDLFSQNIGDLERDKFKAQGKDNETAVRTDGRTSLQSEDGETVVDVDTTRHSIAVHDNQTLSCLEEIVDQLKLLNIQLAEITDREVNSDDLD
jgi:hypothetical protein